MKKDNQNQKFKAEITKIKYDQNKKTKTKLMIQNNKDLKININIINNLHFIKQPFIKHILLYNKLLKDNIKNNNEEIINYIIKIYLKNNKKKMISYNDYLNINLLIK
jgi:hypothetical protein